MAKVRRRTTTPSSGKKTESAELVKTPTDINPPSNEGEKVEVPTPQKSDMGAPKIEIDLEELTALCRMKPTLEDCAAFFKCSPDTVERRIKEATGMTFAEFRDESFVHTKYDLIRHGIQRAKKSDVIYKYVMDNLANWAERKDLTSKGKRIGGGTSKVVIVKLPANGSERKK